MLTRLYSNFSRDERKSLKFDATLIPLIVEPVLDSLTSSLKPLKMDLSWLDGLAAGMQKLCNAVGSDDEAYALREMVFSRCVVPWVQGAMSSSRWDPVVSVEAGMRLYEALLKSACNSFAGAEREEDDILKEIISDEVVRKGVLPRLLEPLVTGGPSWTIGDKLPIPSTCGYCPGCRTFPTTRRWGHCWTTFVGISRGRYPSWASRRRTISHSFALASKHCFRGRSSSAKPSSSSSHPILSPLGSLGRWLA